jgi:hypothetical protein
MNMSPRFVFVSCTKRSRGSRGELLVAQSFDHCGFGAVAELDIVWENFEGLPEIYNRKLFQYAGSPVEYLIFLHDDVYIDDMKLPDKLFTAHERLGYDVVGVAGAVKVNVAYPSLWHLMSEAPSRRGFVHHFTQDGKVHCTSFGPTPDRVAVVDGLFIAVHLPSVQSKGWKFNEEFMFHHYDLACSLDAVALGLNVGVYPIHLIHESPGLNSLSDQSWVESDKRFLAKYAGRSRGIQSW